MHAGRSCSVQGRKPDRFHDLIMLVPKSGDEAGGQPVVRQPSGCNAAPFYDDSQRLLLVPVRNPDKPDHPNERNVHYGQGLGTAGLRLHFFDVDPAIAVFPPIKYPKEQPMPKTIRIGIGLPPMHRVFSIGDIIFTN